jgi:hypothetical protein
MINSILNVRFCHNQALDKLKLKDIKMNQVKKLSGVAMASAAAALLLAGVSTTVVSADTMPAEVKCSGINSCKGTGACATATHSCAGQNSCKGHGWVKATAEECKTKGGEVVAMEK